MVFFNYSRMQMAAKIVYYGPGLCGKTTNLHQIYNKTASDSRGEMVSLETETDRTLFFDLLPIDVGNISGFETRMQLYTVPGQVFYNTTRKLVLKGVDGVVFVADSQRPMLQANLDSFRNLEENLADMGLSVDTLPLVLQYNKRDLADVLPIEDLNKALNRSSWAWFEASAVHGKGVFETLKGISKLTLLALRQRLARSSGSSERPLTPDPARPSAAAAKAPAAVKAAATAAPPAAAPAAPPEVVKPAVAAPVAKRGAEPAARGRKTLDALSELERLRSEATTRKKPPPAAAPLAAAPRPAAANGYGQFFREFQLTLKRADFERARRFSLSLQVEDDEHRVVDTVRGLEVEIQDPSDLDRVLLKLNIALHSKD